VAYRDQQTAEKARIESLERELAEARSRAETHRQENQRLRRILRTYRLGRGVVFAAAGGLLGLAASSTLAGATGHVRLLVPGALLGGLFGMLMGLARDIDGD
jgi:hypothetical protein